jgi:predicted peptidase
MSCRFFLALACIAVLGAVPARASRVQTGFLDRTIEISGIAYRYQVYVPAGYRSKKSWPVILFLHGAGERGSDGLLQTDVGIGHAIRQNPSRFPLIVVFPQCPLGKIWGEPDMQSLAIDALDAAIREFHGDRSHIYLTGLSMGGFGTWETAARNPGRFAAIVPVCGGVQPPKDWPQLRVTLFDDPKITDPFADLARKIGNTPVWMFHGDADQAVPVEQSRQMATALKAAGANVKYTEYAGVDHNSWDKAYTEPELMPWLLAQSLNR